MCEHYRLSTIRNEIGIRANQTISNYILHLLQLDTNKWQKMHDIKFKMPFTFPQIHIPPKCSFVFHILTYEILKQREKKNKYAWLHLQISLYFCICINSVHSSLALLLLFNILYYVWSSFIKNDISLISFNIQTLRLVVFSWDSFRLLKYTYLYSHS